MDQLPRAGDDITGEAEHRCSVAMFNGVPCPREYHTQRLTDGGWKDFCFMHLPDRDKDITVFQTEFEAMLEAAANAGNAADFTGVVFPTGHILAREYAVECLFLGARFLDDSFFRGAKFDKGVRFDWATFDGEADFSDAHFNGNAYFTHAKFGKRVAFSMATFSHAASFIGTEFGSKTLFVNAKFAQRALFTKARFMGDVFFENANLDRGASFDLTRFKGATHISASKFGGDAVFEGAAFSEGANFSKTVFAHCVNFSGASFSKAVEFRLTEFLHDATLLPGPDFSLAQFGRPESVVFYRNYLGQALFHNCDVSRMTFSSVEWRRRGRTGKRMLFEEEVALDAARDLKPAFDSSDERDYGLIAETYQQLKKNYDDRKDYWTAGDFHYGEMEMKRLHSARRNPIAREWHRKMGVVAWYKRLSEYGESYFRPAAVLVGVLIACALLFPWAGLQPNKSDMDPVDKVASGRASPVVSTTELSYRNFLIFVNSYPGRKCSAPFAFFGHSLMTTVSVAAFQKDIRYEPTYPWGAALALIELLLTSTLVALFLLALRRQFRR
jgi:hypothetical protein